MSLQNRVVYQRLWRAIIAGELHFIVGFVDVPVTVPADIDSPAKHLAIQGLTESTTTMNFLRNQMMEGQGQHASAAGTLICPEQTLAAFD